MAIDTAEKRKAVAVLALAFMAPGVTPNASKDAEWRQESAWSYPGIAAAAPAVGDPDDDDTVDSNGDDLTITARTDCDGATLRPPRVTLLHALDGARMASLVSPDRMDMDRYTGFSLRGPHASGYSLSLCPFTTRAGEAFAPKRIVLTVDVTTPSGRGTDAADTTQRTDCDGATLHVPARYLMHAGESARIANLQRVGEDRDRHVTQHDIPTGKGPSVAHSIVPVNDGRAGSCGVPKRIVLIVSVDSDKPLGLGGDI